MPSPGKNGVLVAVLALVAGGSIGAATLLGRGTTGSNNASPTSPQGLPTGTHSSLPAESPHPITVASSAPSCGPHWTQTFLGPVAGDALLGGISGVAPDDLWVVGGTGQNPSGNGHPTRTVALHWDGGRWSVASTPSPGAQENALSAVDSLASDDAWAVGSTLNEGRAQTLILHWDGTSWTLVASPNPGAHGNYLESVAAMSPVDVWAVGSSGNVNNAKGIPLIEHWDGTSWTAVPTPRPLRPGQELWSVAGASAEDVWAVGSDNTRGRSRAFILHWDGSAWRQVSAPDETGVLTSVVVISAHDAWAAGKNVVHWDGHRWSISSLRPAAGQAWGLGVTAVGSRDVWAFGTVEAGQIEGDLSPVRAHWDGKRWRASIGPGRPATRLVSATTFPSGEVWVVGLRGPGGSRQAFVERRCNKSR